jgi:hypothetical protein
VGRVSLEGVGSEYWVGGYRPSELTEREEVGKSSARITSIPKNVGEAFGQLDVLIVVRSDGMAI